MPLGSPSTTDCPPDLAFAELLEGRILGPAAAALERHAGRCSACRELLLGLSSGTAGQGATGTNGEIARALLLEGEEGHVIMKAPVAVGELVAGRYRVERVIGEGGMGVVVAARHVKLGEQVAVKFLLRAALVRPDLIARFQREGRSAVQLRSEHVARVIDAGELPTGEPFLVMEYLEGRDLAAVLKAEGPLPVETAVGYVLQVCEALAEMHALGMVHRDLKPANLFLTRRPDGSPVVKVIDFGISKCPVDDAHGAESGEAVMTESAVVMGSTKYMAPEQMRSARDVDARADLWAVGAILHALTTGAAPFRGLTMMEVYDSILAGAPPLRASRPEAPAGLEAVVLRCLQKDPAQRHADVAELAAALADFGPPEGLVAAKRAWGILHPGSQPQSSPSLPQPSGESVGRTGTEAPVVAALTAPKARRWARPVLVAAAGAMIVGGVALWPSGRPYVDPPAPATVTALAATPQATVVVAPAAAASAPPTPEPSSSAQAPPSAVQPRATASASASHGRSRSAPPAARPTAAPTEPKPIPPVSPPASTRGIF